MKKALFLTLLCSSAFAQTFTLDTFNDGNFAISGNTPFETHSGSMFGGSRRVAIFNGDVSTEMEVAGGQLTFTKPDTQALGLIRYGAFNENYGGGDQTGTAFQVTAGSFSATVTAMSNPFTLWFSVVDSEGLFSEGGVNFTAPGTGIATMTGNADLNDIVGIQVRVPFSTSNSGTYTIDQIDVSPVPEPSTYAAIFALGLAGWSVWRKSRGVC